MMLEGGWMCVGCLMFFLFDVDVLMLGLLVFFGSSFLGLALISNGHSTCDAFSDRGMGS